MNKRHRMNILYCLDETKKDYSRFLGVSIISLLENNKDEDIYIYVITSKLEEENKKELERLVALYGKNIKFSTNKEIIPQNIKEILYKSNFWPIACYYRLFFNNCFSEIDDRLLYFDCDIIISKNISKFYNVDFGNNIIAGGIDVPITRYRTHEEVGTDFDSYINSGVILFNVPKFLSIDLHKEISEANKKYSIKYPDQDYINIIFKGKILIYNGLQSIVSSKFDKDIENALVIHTIAKPGHPFSQCPSKIVEIFDIYLKKTKWRDFYKNKKISIYEVLNFIYMYIRRISTNISLKLFGLSFAVKIDKLFSNFGENIGNFRKKLFK